MTKLGAKLLTATIKNPQKREFIYKFVTDAQFANHAINRENIVEKQLYYVHNYLSKPNLIVVWLVGGLGNQMYLYAFGKALESKGYSVVFDAKVGGYAKNGGGGIAKLPRISAI